jgi:hypothetical protein
MPINIQLIEDGHVLLFQVDKSWNPDEIPAAKEKSRSIFKQAQHTIHALVDLTQASVSLKLIMASQQVIGGEPFPNAGQIVIVGVSKMLQMLAKPALVATGNADTISFFDNVESAKQHLRRYIAQGK